MRDRRNALARSHFCSKPSSPRRQRHPTHTTKPRPAGIWELRPRECPHLLARRHRILERAPLRPEVEPEPDGVVPGALRAQQLQHPGGARARGVGRPAAVRGRLEPGEQRRGRARAAGGRPGGELPVAGGVELDRAPL